MLLLQNLNICKIIISESAAQQACSSVVVSVMDSHSYDLGSSPCKKHMRYALNDIQFKSDGSSAELVLYLCE